VAAPRTRTTDDEGAAAAPRTPTTDDEWAATAPRTPMTDDQGATAAPETRTIGGFTGRAGRRVASARERARKPCGKPPNSAGSAWSAWTSQRALFAAVTKRCWKTSNAGSEEIDGCDDCPSAAAGELGHQKPR
jgi:hypothetical protein